jgi:hypothetical protein
MSRPLAILVPAYYRRERKPVIEEETRAAKRDCLLAFSIAAVLSLGHKTPAQITIDTSLATIRSSVNGFGARPDIAHAASNRSPRKRRGRSPLLIIPSRAPRSGRSGGAAAGAVSGPGAYRQERIRHQLGHAGDRDYPRRLRYGVDLAGQRDCHTEGEGVPQAPKNADLITSLASMTAH